MQVEVKILDPRASLKRETDLSAGYDLIACIDEPIDIVNGKPAVLIKTGLAVKTGAANLAPMILPRSGLGHKMGLVLGNGVGLVDGDYEGELMVSAWNRGNKADVYGCHPTIRIHPGDRIAQLIFVPVVHPEVKVVDEFASKSKRGSGGFGSTGVASNKEACIPLPDKKIPVTVKATLSAPSGSVGEPV